MPVDVVRFARNLGFVVYTAQLNRGVRAVATRDQAGVTVIHVNAADPRGQQVRACAHAVSLCWRGLDVADFGHIVRDEHLGPHGDPESLLAQRFALALLGPT